MRKIYVLRKLLVFSSCWLLLALCSIETCADSGRFRNFPGPQTQLKSPDGLYLVENVDADREPYHSLRLKNARTGTVRMLYNYNRHVTVLWSPDGKNLAVNDYAGSNSSKSLIFSVDQGSPTRDLGSELIQSLKDSPDRRSLVDNHHVYFAVSNWNGNDTLTLKVWGYGDVDPKGFSWRYVYTVGGFFRRLVRH